MAKKEVTKSFVLRIDAEMMDAVEAWAADEFRSTNGQLQWIIAEALKKSDRLKKNRKMKAKSESDVGPDTGYCRNSIGWLAVAFVRVSL